ncbi:hypothetical protein [Gilliamella sp. WF3-4]|uniref:hypothetical protein n=1 Tax=Gilliamella sp. WF3-4 TaxID=3120255 RepID=UPI0011473C67|nr:hypothetical protein [Gilliamella apicola]
MKVSIKYLVSLVFVILPFTPVLAEVHPIQARGDQQLPHQQERQKARQDWLSSTAPAIRLLPPERYHKRDRFSD